MSQRKTPPRAEPQLWHEQSVLAWDMFSERCKVGRAERRKIKERHENRFKKEEK